MKINKEIEEPFNILSICNIIISLRAKPTKAEKVRRARGDQGSTHMVKRKVKAGWKWFLRRTGFNARSDKQGFARMNVIIKKMSKEEEEFPNDDKI